MWLIIIAILGISPAFGQEPALARAGVRQAQVRLSLDQTIEIALKKNLEIESEKSSAAAATQALRGARGVYDPRFRWLATLDSQKTPAASVLQSTGGSVGEHLHSGNFYLGQKLPWGGASVTMGFENSRVSSTNPFLSLSPYTSSRLSFTWTQPLLRGQKIDNERAQIRIRSKQADLSEIQVELTTIEIVSRVQQAYWDLVAARQDATVKADAADWARQQLERIQHMVAAGSLAAFETSAAEAELERRRDGWYTSIQAITAAENALKLLLANSREEALWDEEIIPADEWNVRSPQISDLNSALSKALNSRPELRAIASEQQANQIDKQYQGDLVKPRLNLSATYGLVGIAGEARTGNDPLTTAVSGVYERINRLSEQQGLLPLPATSIGNIPAALLGRYHDALANVFSAQNQGFRVGLEFEFTARNHEAKAALAQSEIAERRLELLQAQAEQAIEADVRNSFQAIQTARQRIAAAEASARAAQEKLESDIRLFEVGESTNFLVLTRQNEYSDARHRLLVANLDLNKAVARVEQALGTTLEDHKIVLK